MGGNARETKAKKAEKKISIEYLLEKFRVDVESGEIYGPRGGRADKLQFFKNTTYREPPRYKQIQISIDGEVVKLSAHRVIWAVANGRWPAEGYVIDHINSNTHDNRISNLEEITLEENIRRGNELRTYGKF